MHLKLFSDYFAKHPRNAGLPVIRFHDLPHTHATLALRAGVHPRIVQERLGHANISITLDTYTHVDLDMQAAVAVVRARLHALEHRESMQESLAIERVIHEELGEDLITALAHLSRPCPVRLDPE